MWDIQPGIDFASRELENFDLKPEHQLYLARQYTQLDWISGPIRALLASPLDQYTQVDKDHLDFELYTIIATAKESIAVERKRLGNHPPIPNNFDNGPFCAQHQTCKKVWIEKWFYVIVRRIHHPTNPLPLFLIPYALQETDHRGMNKDCKEFILSWLRDSCNQVQKEEYLIESTIETVRNLFM
jgi:hypothetical protein